MKGLHSRLPYLSGDWDAAVSKVLACDRKPRNAIDTYTVTVKKGGKIIKNLIRKVSHCSFSPGDPPSVVGNSEELSSQQLASVVGKYADPNNDFINFHV